MGTYRGRNSAFFLVAAALLMANHSVAGAQIVSSASGRYQLRQDGDLVQVLDGAGHHLLTLPHRASAEIRPELFSPREDAIVVLEPDGGASLYDLAGNRRFRLSHSQTKAALFLPGRNVVLIGKEKAIYYRDAATGLSVYSPLSSGGGVFHEVIITGDGTDLRISVLASNSRTGTYRIETAAKLRGQSPWRGATAAHVIRLGR